MSAKVEDGLLFVRKDFLLKRPLPIGGWFLGDVGFLEECARAKDNDLGWGWVAHQEKEYRGAALVAPLSILFWEKE